MSLIPDDPLLLSEQEFREALEFAREVEAGPVREYLRRGPVGGGPKQLDPDFLVEARVALRAAALTKAHHDVLADEADLLMCERMDQWLQAGVPVQFIADAVGYNHRSQVYKATGERLPRLRRERDQRRQLLGQT